MLTRIWKYSLLAVIIIMIVVSLLYVLGFPIFLDTNVATTKHLKYRSYDIPYKQYKDGAKELYKGHAIYNEDLYKQANLILANKLLDEYLQTKDSILSKEIVRLTNTYNLNYVIANFELEEIIKNRKTILDTMIVID